jgi:hypothetical protein
MRTRTASVYHTWQQLVGTDDKQELEPRDQWSPTSSGQSAVQATDRSLARSHADLILQLSFGQSPAHFNLHDLGAHHRNASTADRNDCVCIYTLLDPGGKSIRC